MSGARASEARRKDAGKPGATVRVVVRSWRELTGGTARDRDLKRRTLIACSGGGDSAGLVLALAAGVTRAREVFVVGHVVHDMRGRGEALADRDAARALAERLGLAFVEGEVRVKVAGGNAEAAARRLRYAELERMAREAGCGYVATAHHAEDQLETMLMALVRGAGPRGLAGIAEKRKEGSVKVIRPALGVSRDDLRRVCEGAGWKWREDATNRDESRLRAAIRARVLPELERLRPGAAKRAGRAAGVVRGAARVMAKRAAELMDRDAMAWTRAELQREPEVVLGELVRAAAKRLGGGRDRLSTSVLRRIARAVRDRGTEPRRFSAGGVVVDVTARTVKIWRSDG